MAHDPVIARSPSKAVWILAYLLSPALPFFCLRYASAISTSECLFGVLSALIAQVGLVTVLGAADGDPLQMFVILLLGLSLFMVVLWQFLAGQRRGLWSDRARKQWRTARPGCIRHPSIHKAKGLDSKAVILIGMPPHKDLATDYAYFSWFMAVSRARQLLAVVETG
jgi:hypothetical protein